ncbi:acyl-homoserine-lactone synthase [Hankyongella ginsenosidimutans]|uniref:acyl-homoserine-lactone synthase n=1 Tax=Hankyongella ginsenosidimutans TaxID=1763828 RepID=UPI001FE6D96B|nr:acyl-homoserine-lactone synthase [Hankyongella ginsenosidimutans]
MGWDVPVVGGRYEIDSYDGDKAVYLIATDDGCIHQGSMRLLSTEGAHLLADRFASLCECDAPRGAGSRDYATLPAATIGPRTPACPQPAHLGDGRSCARQRNHHANRRRDRCFSRGGFGDGLARSAARPRAPHRWRVPWSVPHRDLRRYACAAGVERHLCTGCDHSRCGGKSRVKGMAMHDPPASPRCCSPTVMSLSITPCRPS